MQAETRHQKWNASPAGKAAQTAAMNSRNEKVRGAVAEDRTRDAITEERKGDAVRKERKRHFYECERLGSREEIAKDWLS